MLSFIIKIELGVYMLLVGHGRGNILIIRGGRGRHERRKEVNKLKGDEAEE